MPKARSAPSRSAAPPSSPRLPTRARPRTTRTRALASRTPSFRRCRSRLSACSLASRSRGSAGSHPIQNSRPGPPPRGHPTGAGPAAPPPGRPLPPHPRERATRRRPPGAPPFVRGSRAPPASCASAGAWRRRPRARYGATHPQTVRTDRFDSVAPSRSRSSTASPPAGASASRRRTRPSPFMQTTSTAVPPGPSASSFAFPALDAPVVRLTAGRVVRIGPRRRGRTYRPRTPDHASSVAPPLLDSRPRYVDAQNAASPRYTDRTHSSWL